MVSSPKVISFLKLIEREESIRIISTKSHIKILHLPVQEAFDALKRKFRRYKVGKAETIELSRDRTRMMYVSKTITIRIFRPRNMYGIALSHEVIFEDKISKEEALRWLTQPQRSF